MKVKATIRTYALVAKDPVTDDVSGPLTKIPNLMYTQDGKPIIAHTEEALSAYLEGEGGDRLAIRLIGETEITLIFDDRKLKMALESLK